MQRTMDPAYRLGCGRLLFEHGAVDKLGAEARRYGKKALLAYGGHAFMACGGAVNRSLAGAGITAAPVPFTGPCCEEKARDWAERCGAEGADLIIGVGGGRVLDTAKLAAELAGVPVLTVPTVSATCAAYTPLSVVYTPEGAFRGSWHLRREVDGMICDLDVLDHQPARCLAAGILDAMAKHVEMLHYRKSGDVSLQALLAAEGLAQALYCDLCRVGMAALADLAAGRETIELENCIFMTLVLPGLVSGLARGERQSALGHGLYESAKRLFPQAAAGALHGEIVAVGLLLQTCFWNLEAEEKQIRLLLRALNLPDSLQALGLPCDQASLRLLAGCPPMTRSLARPEDAARVETLLRSLTAPCADEGKNKA